MSDGTASHHSSIENISSAHAHYDVPIDETQVLINLALKILLSPVVQPPTNPDLHEQPKAVDPLPVPPYPEKGQTVNDQIAFDFSINQADEVALYKLDLNDRDPHKQNQGLKTGFLEVFAEPDPTYHSIACVWTFSFRTFEITRIYVYKVLTLILALPVALFMGLLFALATFIHIWMIKPLVRLMRIALQQLFIIWPMILIYLVRPCFYSMGAVFSTFRLHQTNGPIIEEPWMVLVERP